MSPEPGSSQASQVPERPNEAPSLGEPTRSGRDRKARKLILVRRAPGTGEVTITSHGLALIERAAAEGVSKHTIAQRLGIGAKTFRELLRRDERAQEAYDVGNAANETELRNLLMEKARAGNVTAAIYLTKARHGWTEGEAPDTRPNVVINLPGAMSPEQYMRAIRQGAIEHDEE